MNPYFKLAESGPVEILVSEQNEKEMLELYKESKVNSNFICSMEKTEVGIVLKLRANNVIDVSISRQVEAKKQAAR